MGVSILGRPHKILLRHVYPNVDHSTVYNSQEMEATQMPISRRMDKKAVVYILWNITQPLKRIHLNQF